MQYRDHQQSRFSTILQRGTGIQLSTTLPCQGSFRGQKINRHRFRCKSLYGIGRLMGPRNESASTSQSGPQEKVIPENGRKDTNMARKAGISKDHQQKGNSIQEMYIQSKKT